MNSQTAGKKLGFGRLVFFWTLLSFLLISSFWGASSRAETPPKGFRVTYPARVDAGEAIKIRVRFSSPPPSHHFYKMEVTVDGQPVAMVDISEESSTWVTAPGQPEGRHQIAVIWRNPPGGIPKTVARDLSVLPKAPPATGLKTP